MEIRADRRCRQLDPDPERVAAARDAAATYREAQLRMARLLVALEAGRDHLGYGHATVRDFAALELGLARRDVPLLLDLGRSLGFVVAADERNAPSDGEVLGDTSTGTPTSTTVEDRVRDRQMSVDNAAQLGRLLNAAGVVPEDERGAWMRLAETTSPWRFSRLVRKALEDAAQAERTVSLGLSITESARDDFRRARELASRRAGRLLTEGQVFAVVVRRYVAAEDECLVGERARRVGPTAELPSRRYVPAAVKRAVHKRAADRCEVPGCSNTTILELMHLRVPHAWGGARELSNLALGCRTHHVLLDAGVIRFAGWNDDGKPCFRTTDGRLLGEPRPVTGGGGSALGSSVSDVTTHYRCGPGAHAPICDAESRRASLRSVAARFRSADAGMTGSSARGRRSGGLGSGGLGSGGLAAIRARPRRSRRWRRKRGGVAPGATSRAASVP